MKTFHKSSHAMQLATTPRFSATRFRKTLLAVLHLAAGVLPVLAQDPAADDFQRASLGANWTKYNANAEIVNGADLGSPTPSTTSQMYVGWTASTFAADQFCEAVVAARPDTMLIQLFVRRRASDVARNAFVFTDENGSGGIGAPNGSSNTTACLRRRRAPWRARWPRRPRRATRCAWR